MHAKSLQLCPTLFDPIDCSLPGSSVHGILQERILEWVALPSSRGSSRPRDSTHISYVFCTGRRILYHQCHLGSLRNFRYHELIFFSIAYIFFREKYIYIFLSQRISDLMEAPSIGSLAFIDRNYTQIAMDRTTWMIQKWWNTYLKSKSNTCFDACVVLI